MGFILLAILAIIINVAMLQVLEMDKGIPHLKKIIISLLMIGFVKTQFFYADPGYTYHVRTLLSQERVINTVGWSWDGGGSTTAWKNATTIQVKDVDDSSHANTITPPKLVFLDQVDAKGYATARFKIPTDKTAFLRMVHEYRTPKNLMVTELIPAFKTTFQATSGLMSAEEYFSGSKTTFLTEFQNQLRNGIYLVKREERRVVDNTQERNSSANASLKDQEKYTQSKTKVIFQVNKQHNPDGSLIVTPQNYTDYGITMVSARVTDLIPNPAFEKRMQAKQKASADRSIAREQRIQEEQQKLLEIAKGERQVATKQAAAKVIQIEKTTAAETTKQLAITAASQQMEQATIDKETASLLLDKAEIDAKSTRVTAAAEAYRRKSIMSADNSLQAKLDAEVSIQKVWAIAFSKRNVPTTIFGGNNSTGSDSEVTNFMNLMTMQAAKSLDYNRNIK